MYPTMLLGIDKGIKGLQNFGLGQNLTSQDAYYHNQNLFVNLIPNHLKISSGDFGPLNHFLDPNPDFKELLSVVKSIS